MSLSVDDLITRQVQLRDKRAAMAKEFKLKDDSIKEVMDRVEAELLRRLNEAGSDSFKTGAGTAYVVTKTRYGAADWTGFWSWLKEHGRLDMLEKRISSKAVADYQEEHGEVPPFLNVSTEREVVVRRA